MDREFNNLLSDLLTNNPPFLTHKNGSIDTLTTVYAENHPSIFGVPVSPPLSVAPSVTRSVSVILPDIPMADSPDLDEEN